MNYLKFTTNQSKLTFYEQCSGEQGMRGDCFLLCVYCGVVHVYQMGTFQ